MVPDVNIVVFDGFEPLDVFGPFEVFIDTDGVGVRIFSLDGPGVKFSEGGAGVEALGPEEIDPKGVLLINGGSGTRVLVDDDRWMAKLRSLAAQSSKVLSVCTGERVDWIKEARWVVDGKFRTSSGISAGIDMALDYVEDTCGPEAADKASTQMEYIRNRESGYDPFARSNA